MRFITEDSYKGKIENPLSLNYYGYCKGDPVGYIDSSGKVRQRTKNIESYESPAGRGDWAPGSIVDRTGSRWVTKANVISKIKYNPGLIKDAEEVGKNQRIQQEANNLINQLISGNVNPGKSN